LYEVHRQDLQVLHDAQLALHEARYQTLQTPYGARHQILQSSYEAQLSLQQRMIEKTKESRKLIFTILMSVIAVFLAVILRYHM
jgi:hypothetical protein